MAHSAKHLHESDKQPLGAKTNKVFILGLIAGFLGLGGALLLAIKSDADLTRFGFAYLVNFLWVLAITLGCLFVVIITHLFRAGWVVVVRRLFEAVAVNIWVVGLLSLPIIGFAIAGRTEGMLFPWTQKREQVEHKTEDAKAFLEKVEAVYAGHEGGELAKDSEYRDVKIGTDRPAVVMPAAEAASQYSSDPETAKAQQKAHWQVLTEHALHYKAWGGDHGFRWYTREFFALRLIAYFLIWGVMAWFYWNHSVRQDKTRDPALTNKREWWAPLSVIIFAATITLAAYDLVLSLDPTWFSTMFGVYFFANATLAGLCVVALLTMLLSKKGLLKTATTDHLHDIGKLMFAFSFFWGYVAYSQYMLIWYASIPEETYWFEIHGVTTVGSAPQYGSCWSKISIVLLVCHLFIPFAFLLSKHVKRNRLCLAAASVFLLAVVWLDFFWLVMPSFTFLKTGTPGTPVLGLPELLTFIGLFGFAAAGVARRLAKVSPIAHGDPRLHESVNLDTETFTPFFNNY